MGKLPTFKEEIEIRGLKKNIKSTKQHIKKQEKTWPKKTRTSSQQHIIDSYKNTNRNRKAELSATKSMLKTMKKLRTKARIRRLKRGLGMKTPFPR